MDEIEPDHPASLESIERLDLSLKRLDVLAQGLGILMARHHCTRRRAAALLQEMAGVHGLTTYDVAQELVAQAERRARGGPNEPE